MRRQSPSTRPFTGKLHYREKPKLPLFTLEQILQCSFRTTRDWNTPEKLFSCWAYQNNHGWSQLKVKWFCVSLRGWLSTLDYVYKSSLEGVNLFPTQWFYFYYYSFFLTCIIFHLDVINSINFKSPPSMEYRTPSPLVFVIPGTEMLEGCSFLVKLIKMIRADHSWKLNDFVCHWEGDYLHMIVFTSHL